MPDLTLVILAAGDSTRFSTDVKKQWLRIGSKPLWQFVADRLSLATKAKEVIITASKKELRYMQKHGNYTIIKGASSRQESLKNAIEHVKTTFVLVTDVARACIPHEMLNKILESKGKADIIVPYLDIADTVVYQNETIDREKTKLIQTPQLSKCSVLKRALNQNKLYTDDSSAIKAAGGTVFYVKGSIKAKKITTFDDLAMLTCLSKPDTGQFVGVGFDVHEFCNDKDMFLGGVKIESRFGFKAHSDGDVALHALIDSLLGAIGCGDIGELYPDTDDKYKGIDSKKMLKEVVSFIKAVGFEIQNVDITIMAQTPKLSPYKDSMREKISSILRIAPIRVNIKATTTEKLGFVGRKEGVAAEAVTSLHYFNWKKI